MDVKQLGCEGLRGCARDGSEVAPRQAPLKAGQRVAEVAAVFGWRMPKRGFGCRIWFVAHKSHGHATCVLRRLSIDVRKNPPHAQPE